VFEFYMLPSPLIMSVLVFIHLLDAFDNFIQRA